MYVHMRVWREGDGDRQKHRETYFKELVHTVVEAGKSKTCREGVRLEAHRKVYIATQVQR